MAKVGYIFKASDYSEYESDKAFMQQYGCVQFVEESEKHDPRDLTLAVYNKK